ncbi:hypothetical protein B7486_61110, partial [cyanobacterium TDX16]
MHTSSRAATCVTVLRAEKSEQRPVALVRWRVLARVPAHLGEGRGVRSQRPRRTWGQPGWQVRVPSSEAAARQRDGQGWSRRPLPVIISALRCRRMWGSAAHGPSGVADGRLGRGGGERAEGGRAMGDQGDRAQAAVDAAVEERAALAQELHDTVGQRLWTVGLVLDRIVADAPPGMEPGLAELADQLREMRADLRCRLHRLNRSALGDRTLCEALTELSRELAARGSVLLLDLPPQSSEIDPRVEDQLWCV